MKAINNNFYMIFLILLIILFALCAFTFHKAKGMSYFSDDSKACNNCHIMNEVYSAYLKAPHSKKIDGKAKASCNDCHLPQEGVNKWLQKAKSGFNHAYAFTFKLEELPINLSANKDSKKIVEQNCISCHSKIAAAVINPTTKPHKDKSLGCISCHANSGHLRSF